MTGNRSAHHDILPPYNLRAAVRHLKRSDATLAAMVERIGPCRLHLYERRNPFEALLRSIVHQQLSGKAAATIHARLVALLPHGLTAGHLLELPERALRGAGLSRNKVLAVRDLAHKTLAGVVPGQGGLDGLHDDEIVERLIAVRGVGRWTVEMLLIFTLGRPDVLPLDDLGVRKGFRVTYGMKRLPAASTLRRTARCWAPYRSVASWYLWRAAELG
ncbi:MAG TPA: DNA-3-methyladenine glycosylase [Gammaproteobacteria bacterium]|nr:DNA-3-methyladenine glycosylase [Gammaproteobacteria bacterium]